MRKKKEEEEEGQIEIEGEIKTEPKKSLSKAE